MLEAFNVSIAGQRKLSNSSNGGPALQIPPIGGYEGAKFKGGNQAFGDGLGGSDSWQIFPGATLDFSAWQWGGPEYNTLNI